MLATFHRILENSDEKSVSLKWEPCVCVPSPHFDRKIESPPMSTSAHKWLILGEIKQVDFLQVGRQGKLEITALFQLKVRHGGFMIQQIEPFKIDHDVGWVMVLQWKTKTIYK